MYYSTLQLECFCLISEDVLQSSHICVLVNWQNQNNTSSYFAPSSPFQHLVKPISFLCHLIVPFNFSHQTITFEMRQSPRTKFLLRFNEGSSATYCHYCDADPKLIYFILSVSISTSLLLNLLVHFHIPKTVTKNSY